MTPTPHQQQKHDEVIQAFRDGHKRVVLTGSAGTGKTTTADLIINTLKRDYTINPNYNNGTIQVCTPTNKALAVIKGKVSSSVQFSTIHSALKLKKFTDRKTGIEMFTRPKFTGRIKPDDFSQCKFALIDEASMLGKSIEGSVPSMEDRKEDMVMGHLDRYNFPILYLGDNKQLSPVKEKYSPVFYKGYYTVELTEIVRQGENNPIIALSKDLDMMMFKQPNVINGKGYLYSNAKDQFIEHLAEVNGTDELKYLAFTNNTVNDINFQVRSRIYSNPKRIEAGETIIFNSPYGSHYTNKELKVEGLEIITDYIFVPTERTYFDSNNEPVGKLDKLKIKFYLINGEVPVLHEQSDRAIVSIANAINEKCNNNGWDYRGKEYFKNQLASVTYNHAITIHKSQGSTYKETIINIKDIMINPSSNERTRLLYTAVTRASDLIILNNV